jgi:hypothetical protein
VEQDAEILYYHVLVHKDKQFRFFFTYMESVVVFQLHDADPCIVDFFTAVTMKSSVFWNIMLHAL